MTTYRTWKDGISMFKPIFMKFLAVPVGGIHVIDFAVGLCIEAHKDRSVQIRLVK